MVVTYNGALIAFISLVIINYSEEMCEECSQHVKKNEYVIKKQFEKPISITIKGDICRECILTAPTNDVKIIYPVCVKRNIREEEIQRIKLSISRLIWNCSCNIFHNTTEIQRHIEEYPQIIADMLKFGSSEEVPGNLNLSNFKLPSTKELGKCLDNIHNAVINVNPSELIQPGGSSFTGFVTYTVEDNTLFEIFEINDNRTQLLKAPLEQGNYHMINITFQGAESFMAISECLQLVNYWEIKFQFTSFLSPYIVNINDLSGLNRLICPESENDTGGSVLDFLNPLQVLLKLIPAFFDSAVSAFVNDVGDAAVPILNPIEDLVGEVVSTLKSAEDELLSTLKPVEDVVNETVPILNPIEDVVGEVVSTLKSAEDVVNETVSTLKPV